MAIEKPEIKSVSPSSQEEWREWLQANHAVEQAVWVVYHKKKSGKTRVEYSDAVDEALCFGWIDSTAKPIDENTYKQFFSRRKPKSVWSRVNKEKVARLTEAGKMTAAGLVSIEIAKQNSSWTILDTAEALLIPPDLDDEFAKKPAAKTYFLGLSRTDKRNILQWLVLAKRAETRQKRIEEIVSLAAEQKKPKQFTVS